MDTVKEDDVIDKRNQLLFEFLPSSIIPNVSSFLKIKDNITMDIVISTKDGQFVTYSKRFPVDCCDIPSKEVLSIMKLENYSLQFRHFLLRTKGALIVLKQSDSLEVKRVFEDVFNVEFGDFWNTGTPQVAIYTNAESEPLVTDFVTSEAIDGNCEISVQSDLANSLITNLQELKLQIDSAETSLRNRVLGRKLCVHNIFMDDCNVNDLIFSKPQRKIVHSQFCIVIPIKYNGASSIYNLNATVQTSEYFNEMIKISWFLLHRPKRGPHEANTSNDLEYVTPLPNNMISNSTKAFFIIVSPLPAFAKENIFTVTGSLFYTKTEDDIVRQMSIPPVKISAQDFFHLLNVPKSHDLTVHDILAVISASHCARIKMEYAHRPQQTLEMLLVKHMNFKKVNNLNYFLRYEVLVHVFRTSTWNVSLDVYTRLKNEAAVILRVLHSRLPDRCKFSENTVTRRVDSSDWKCKMRSMLKDLEKFVPEAKVPLTTKTEMILSHADCFQLITGLIRMRNLIPNS